MALLPSQIIPETVPIGRVGPDGKVRLEHNWYLLIYNLWLNVLGAGSAQGLPSDALQDLASADTDAIDADAIALRRPVANLAEQAMQPEDVVTSPDDLPDIARALLLAQDDLLEDPVPLAQPVAAVVVGASPFTFVAPAAGHLLVVGGVVSAISLTRQGTATALGLTSGFIPVSRYDSVKVTYTGVPTITFIPWSGQ